MQLALSINTRKKDMEGRKMYRQEIKDDAFTLFVSL